MRRFLKDLFSFSRTELRLVLIFSCILFIVILIRIFLSISSSDDYIPTETEMKLINDFVNSLEKEDSLIKSVAASSERVYYTSLRNFNPNTVLPEEMKEMGFPEQVISNLTKYRIKGGRFSSPPEFRKIYGITDSIFTVILPYIIISDSSPVNKKRKGIPADSGKINISIADSSELINLRGIGPVFAARIIKYRNRLGGFYRVDQLLEVYGMDSARFHQIRPLLYADSIHLRKIKVNSTTVTEMIRHPYIDIKTAQSLISFRNYRRHIADIGELDTLRGTGTVILEKVKPYLSTEP